MNKNEFLKLDILKQVEFINSKTLTGLTVIKVAAEIGIGEKTLRLMLKSNNYVFNRPLKVYLLSGDSVVKPQLIQKDNKVITPKVIPNHNKNIIPKVIQKHNNDKTEIAITEDNNLLEEVKELLSMKDDLKELIQSYKRSKTIIDVIEPPELKVDKTRLKGVLKGRLVKVYDNVNNDWIKFCKRNDEFKMQDLYSMALLEYIEKYDKI